MSTSNTRVRRMVTIPELQGVIPLGYYQNWSTSQKKWGLPTGHVEVNSSSFPKYLQGRICIDELHKGPPFLEGGPFQSMRVNTCEPPLGVYGVGVHMRQDGLKRYVGGFQIPFESDWGTGVSMSSFDPYLTPISTYFPTMVGWGDAAYARCKPRMEKAGGAVFTAELRDLPRMMKTTARGFKDLYESIGGSSVSHNMSPKKAADHFLNHQFGWIPFINDLGKFYNAFDRMADHIDRLSRENGQWVKRKATLKEETTRTVLASGTGVSLFPNTSFTSPFAPWFPGVATWQLTEELTTRIFAVGRFRYYRPEFDRADPDYLSKINAMKRRATIYGFRISPSNVYKATPWSWALDWISNVGDQIDHANDVLVDSVATKYLYVMRHEVKVRKFIQTIPFISGDVSLEFSRVIESKQRQEASGPYGFNLTLANLTPRQLAIAGALGVSKGYKH